MDELDLDDANKLLEGEEEYDPKVTPQDLLAEIKQGEEEDKE